MMHIFEHIKEMPLRHAFPYQGAKGFEFFRGWLSFEAFEVWLSRVVNGQFRVGRKGGIEPFGDLPEALLEVRHKGYGGLRHLQRLAIGGQTGEALRPWQQLPAIVGIRL